MKRSRIAAICLYVAAFLYVIGKAETPSKPASDIPPALVQHTDRAAAVVEMQNDWIEQYESNGPEGAAAVPMQKSTWSQLALAVVVLMGCSFLAARAEKNPIATNGSEKRL